MAKYDDYDTVNGLYPDEFDITTEEGRQGLNSWEDKSVVSIVDPGLEYPEEYTEEQPSYVGRYIVICDLCKVPALVKPEELEGEYTCPHCAEIGAHYQISGVVDTFEGAEQASKTDYTDDDLETVGDLVEEEPSQAGYDIFDTDVEEEEFLTEDIDLDDHLEEEGSEDTLEDKKPVEKQKYKIVIIDEVDEVPTKITAKFSAESDFDAYKKAVAILLDPTHASTDFNKTLTTFDDEAKQDIKYWTEDTLVDLLNNDNKAAEFYDSEGEVIFNKDEEGTASEDLDKQNVVLESKKFGEGIEITNDDIKQGFVVDPKTGKRKLLDPKTSKILKEAFDYDVTDEDIKNGFILRDRKIYQVGSDGTISESKSKSKPGAKLVKEDIDVSIKNTNDAQITVDGGNVNVDTDGEPVEDEYDEEDMEDMEDDFSEEDLSEDDFDPEDEVIRPLTDEEAVEVQGIEDFEIEESYINKLVGRFLTENYSNVKNFRASEFKKSGSNLIIEGAINYKSGKIAQTKFIFEGFKLKEGIQTLKGSNVMFGRGKSFVMKTAMKENKILAEGLKYNYTTRDAKNNLFQITGRVDAKN